MQPLLQAPEDYTKAGWFLQLPLTVWPYDADFRAAFGPSEADQERAAALQADFATMPLWQLLGQLESQYLPGVLAYYDWPMDTLAFIQWLQDYARLGDPEATARDVYERHQAVVGTTTLAEQMRQFPFDVLYQLWATRTPGSTPEAVLIYPDRVTDRAGSVLLRYAKSIRTDLASNPFAGWSQQRLDKLVESLDANLDCKWGPKIPV